MKRNPQPAYKSYFFGQSYKDMLDAIKNLWLLNAQSAQKYNRWHGYNGFASLKGIFWFVCALSVVTFGTMFFVAISVIFTGVLLLFFMLVYIWLAIIWSVDRAYLYKNKIFTACNECKEKSLIPTYVCGRCGARHTNLTPGVYGIIKRRCKCGNKLATTAFNGRRMLAAICANCGRNLYDRECVPICIPVVGGRSVGKTAFITAFSSNFIERVAPSKGWRTSFYNQAKARIYDEIKTDYEKGSTRMTDRVVDINKTSSISFSFFVNGKCFHPDRLVHVYDIAGEVFTDGDENEVQKQYEYCHGIVLMIDPFSIDSIRYKYEKGLTNEDMASIGMADINGIINTFLNKLRNVTGLSDRKMMKVPLAIVISKIDSGMLFKEFTKDKIDGVRREYPNVSISNYDALDCLCRRFLIDNNMQSFLNIIEMKFKKNRFFVCTAIGHTRDSGRYKPIGVIEPMEWLFQNADRKMKRHWNDIAFTGDPKKVFEKGRL